MLLFLILTFIALFLFYKNFHKTGPLPSISYLLPLLVFYFFLIDVKAGNTEYFISDELVYLEQQYINIKGFINRAIWYGINLFEVKFDLLPYISLKLINIPLLFIFIYSLWFIFDKNNKIFLLVILLPYINIVATKNLRDILIYLSTLMVAYLFYQERRLLVIIPVIFLLFLRPFVVIYIFILILSIDIFISFYKVLRFKSSCMKMDLKKVYRILGFAIAIILILYFFYPTIENRVEGYYYRIKVYTGEQHYQRIEKLDAIETGSKAKNYLIAAARYTFAPIPTSIFNRFMEGGSESGVLDDLIRVLNQTFYYFIFIYVLFNMRWLIKVFLGYTKMQKLTILSFLMYMPIYSFYRFGIGHQRVKLPFQIAIFILFLSIMALKRKCKMENETGHVYDNC